MPPRRKGQIIGELVGGPVLDEGFARELVDRARWEGVNLVGPGGLQFWVINKPGFEHTDWDLRATE